MDAKRASNCAETYGHVFPASRTSKGSPMQKMTDNPPLTALAVLAQTSYAEREVHDDT